MLRSTGSTVSFLILAALAVSCTSQERLALVTDELGLLKALINPLIDDITITNDITITWVSLNWSSSVASAASSASKTSTSQLPVPVTRPVLLRGVAFLEPSPSSSSPSPSNVGSSLGFPVVTAPSTPVRKAVLDLRLANGWLALAPNATLTLQDLTILTQQPTAPALQPFHPLLAALVAPSNSTASQAVTLSPAPSTSSSPTMQQRKVTISVNRCIDLVDVGLPQLMAASAAVAESAASGAVGALVSLVRGYVCFGGADAAATASGSGSQSRRLQHSEQSAWQQLWLTDRLPPLTRRPMSAALHAMAGAGWLHSRMVRPELITFAGDQHSGLAAVAGDRRGVLATDLGVALPVSSPLCMQGAIHVHQLQTLVSVPASTSDSSLGNFPPVDLRVSDSYSVPSVSLDPECLTVYQSDNPDLGVAECVRQARLLLDQEASGGGSGGKWQGLTVALASLLPVVVVLIIALAVVAFLYRRLRLLDARQRGARTAPGVGPMTTLVVTDIANSTALWECLPEQVMDTALKLHHTCLRAVLVRYNGYESATEGDSFILAFHHPADAAKFALSAQMQLMDVMWPNEVLAHPDGQEVWVEPRAAAQANDGGLPFCDQSLFIDMVPGTGGGGGVGSLSYSGHGGGRRDASGRRASWAHLAARQSRHYGGSADAVSVMGLARTADVELPGPTSLVLYDEDFAPVGRTGSQLIRNITTRVTTMLGFVPTSGSGNSGLESRAESGSRAGRHRVREMLSRSVTGLYASASAHGYSSRVTRVGDSSGEGMASAGGLPAQRLSSLEALPAGSAARGRLRFGPTAEEEEGKEGEMGGAQPLQPGHLRAQSFAAGSAPSYRRPALRSVAPGKAQAAPISDGDGGGVGCSSAAAEATSGSLIGPRSLLRLALSMRRRQGSFRSSRNTGDGDAAYAAGPAVVSVRTQGLHVSSSQPAAVQGPLHPRPYPWAGSSMSAHTSTRSLLAGTNTASASVLPSGTAAYPDSDPGRQQPGERGSGHALEMGRAVSRAFATGVAHFHRAHPRSINDRPPSEPHAGGVASSAPAPGGAAQFAAPRVAPVERSAAISSRDAAGQHSHDEGMSPQAGPDVRLSGPRSSREPFAGVSTGRSPWAPRNSPLSVSFRLQGAGRRGDASETLFSIAYNGGRAGAAIADPRHGRRGPAAAAQLPERYSRSPATDVGGLYERSGLRSRDGETELYGDNVSYASHPSHSTGDGFSSHATDPHAHGQSNASVQLVLEALNTASQATGRAVARPPRLPPAAGNAGAAGAAPGAAAMASWMLGQTPSEKERLRRASAPAGLGAARHQLPSSLGQPLHASGAIAAAAALPAASNGGVPGIFGSGRTALGWGDAVDAPPRANGPSPPSGQPNTRMLAGQPYYDNHLYNAPLVSEESRGAVAEASLQPAVEATCSGAVESPAPEPQAQHASPGSVPPSHRPVRPEAPSPAAPPASSAAGAQPALPARPEQPAVAASGNSRRSLAPALARFLTRGARASTWYGEGIHTRPASGSSADPSRASHERPAAGSEHSPPRSPAASAGRNSDAAPASPPSGRPGGDVCTSSPQRRLSLLPAIILRRSFSRERSGRSLGGLFSRPGLTQSASQNRLSLGDGDGAAAAAAAAVRQASRSLLGGSTGGAEGGAHGRGSGAGAGCVGSSGQLRGAGTRGTEAEWPELSAAGIVQSGRLSDVAGAAEAGAEAGASIKLAPAPGGGQHSQALWTGRHEPWAPTSLDPDMPASHPKLSAPHARAAPGRDPSSGQPHDPGPAPHPRAGAGASAPAPGPSSRQHPRHPSGQHAGPAADPQERGRHVQSLRSRSKTRRPASQPLISPRPPAPAALMSTDDEASAPPAGATTGSGPGRGAAAASSAFPPPALTLTATSSRRRSFALIGSGQARPVSVRRNSVTLCDISPRHGAGAEDSVMMTLDGMGGASEAGFVTGGWGTLTGSQVLFLHGEAECRTWKDYCRREWPPALRPAPPARCAFRGLRVRMGLHTGVAAASDVTFNPTTSHMAYGGTALKVAKAVGDAAAGGMILISHTTFLALVSGLAQLPGCPQAVFSGESDLGLAPPPDTATSVPYSMYQLIPRELAPRQGYLSPLRNIALSQLGSDGAPTGVVAISFMHIASASMLVAELGQPGVEALHQFKSLATSLCGRCGGYVVEASEGLCLVAFRHAAAALVWALSCQEALAAHTWSAEVRRWYRFSSTAPATAASLTAARASGHTPGSGGGGSSGGGRGPRPRTGVHVGGVAVEVNATTGRLTYRGKVMNRTSRIAHKAQSGQLLCSQEAWDAVAVSIAEAVRQIEEKQQEEEREEEEARRRREQEALLLRAASGLGSVLDADAASEAAQTPRRGSACRGAATASSGAGGRSGTAASETGVEGGGGARRAGTITGLLTWTGRSVRGGMLGLMGGVPMSPASPTAAAAPGRGGSVPGADSGLASQLAPRARSLTPSVADAMALAGASLRGRKSASAKALFPDTQAAVAAQAAAIPAFGSAPSAASPPQAAGRMPPPGASYRARSDTVAAVARGPSPVAAAAAAPADALPAAAGQSGSIGSRRSRTLAAFSHLFHLATRAASTGGSPAGPALPAAAPSPAAPAAEPAARAAVRASRSVPSTPPHAPAGSRPGSATGAALAASPFTSHATRQLPALQASSTPSPAASRGARSPLPQGPSPCHPRASASASTAAAAAGASPSLHEPPASREWEALRSLVGERAELPPARRLGARFLGHFSLKGVREEMRLYDVRWEAEGGEAADSEGAGEGAGAAAREGAGRGAGGLETVKALLAVRMAAGGSVDRAAGVRAAARAMGAEGGSLLRARTAEARAVARATEAVAPASDGGGSRRGGAGMAAAVSWA